MAFFLRGRLALPLVCALPALLALGCGDGTVEGDLGVGTFQYRCLDEGDAACAAAGPSTEGLSLGIATGAEIGLAFFQNDRDKPTGVVFPAATTRMVITDRGFRALLPGQVAVLARTADGTGVLDFTHLTLVAPAKLSVVAPVEAKGTASLALGFGAERTLEVVPVDDQGKKLAGSFAYTWVSDAPNIVEIKEASTVRRATIAVREAGTAHVRVAAQGVPGEVELTVVVGGAGAAGAGGQGN